MKNIYIQNVMCPNLQKLRAVATAGIVGSARTLRCVKNGNFLHFAITKKCIASCPPWRSQKLGPTYGSAYTNIWLRDNFIMFIMPKCLAFNSFYILKSVSKTLYKQFIIDDSTWQNMVYLLNLKSDLISTLILQLEKCVIILNIDEKHKWKTYTSINIILNNFSATTFQSISSWGCWVNPNIIPLLHIHIITYPIPYIFIGISIFVICTFARCMHLHSVSYTIRWLIVGETIRQEKGVSWPILLAAPISRLTGCFDWLIWPQLENNMLAGVQKANP